jgi:hypothetical protein
MYFTPSKSAATYGSDTSTCLISPYPVCSGVRMTTLRMDAQRGSGSAVLQGQSGGGPVQ